MKTSTRLTSTRPTPTRLTGALAPAALLAAALAVPAAPSLAQPLPGAAAGDMSNTWRSSERSRFHHVLEAEPGRHRLTITASTSSPGGETVAVYPQTAGGERGSPRIGFVIATRAGNSEELFVTIPAPAEGETLGRLPIVVDVENASGREYSGEYTLTLSPA